MPRSFAAAYLVGMLATLLFGGPAELRLIDAGREYAPSQAIGVRLTNRGKAPIFIITEVRPGLRTAQGRALPGVPVYERRRQKSFFRSERRVYSTEGRARFRAAALEPGDSMNLSVKFPTPAKYKVYVRYWRAEEVARPEEFLKLDVQEIERRYARETNWTSTPAFRVLPPEKKLTSQPPAVK